MHKLKIINIQRKEYYNIRRKKKVKVIFLRLELNEKKKTRTRTKKKELINRSILAASYWGGFLYAQFPRFFFVLFFSGK